MSDGFLYRWTDIERNMFYIGVHKGTEDDGYICSSKYMMAEYKTRPHSFTRDIVETGDYEEMRKLEIKVLKEVDARHNPQYYNRSNGTHHLGYQKGKRTPESIEKGRVKLLGHKKSKEWSDSINKNPEKIRKTAEKHKGMKRSLESRQKMSEAKKDYVPWNAGKTGIYSDAQRDHIGSMNRGKIWFHDPSTGKNLLFLPDEAPTNFTKGMKKKKWR